MPAAVSLMNSEFQLDPGKIKCFRTQKSFWILHLEFDSGQPWALSSRYVSSFDADCSTKAGHQVG